MRQYQFVQTSLHDLEIRLAVARPLSAEEEAALRAWAGAKFDPQLSFTFKYFDEIPRTPAGKFHDFISLVAPPSAEGFVSEGVK